MEIDAKLVKKLRTGKPWSQEQLSEACGLNLRTIQRLESSGKGSIESVTALAFALDVEPNELIQIDNEAELTPLDAIKSGFIEFSNFTDRATRYEYWWFFLFVLLISAAAAIINETVLQIVSVVMLLPLVAVGFRRLNDINRSGWWQLLFLVPFGMIVIFYLLAQEGSVNNIDSAVKEMDAD